LSFSFPAKADKADMSLLKLYYFIHKPKRMQHVRIRAEKVDAILDPLTRINAPIQVFSCFCDQVRRKPCSCHFRFTGSNPLPIGGCQR
jgi:hypothetical protein